MRCTVSVIVLLSVCPSVRPSVTLVDCVHMDRPTTMISSPYGSPIILVSGDIKFIPKFEGGHPELLVTVRRYALHGICYSNSVCPSVCLSVTLVDCVHMGRPTIIISSPYGSPIILVSGDIKFIQKFEGGHPERGRWMRVGWVRIGDFRPCRRISETVRDTTKVTSNITNRKSYTRFRLVPKSTTLVDPRSLDCFTWNFSKTVCDTAKVTIDN